MRTVVTILAVLFAVCSLANAQLSTTYTDKVTWRGFELFGETDAFIPQINVKIGPVDVDARGNLANDSGYGALERWDAQVAYTLGLDPVIVKAGYGYYLYPDSKLDFQEVFATLGLPLGPVTPRVTAVYADADGPVESAWLYVVGADIKLAEKARGFVEATYNDGFNPFGGSIDSAWTHALAGASLDVPVMDRLVLTPAVYYQRTFEEAVNPEEDQVWFSVTLAYTF